MAEAREGVLLADKPAGPTSHDVVAAARRALGVRRVGHAGTLDPFATGLLVLLVGRATRLAEYVSELDKTYVATLRLGASSTTGDPEGELEELDPPRPVPDETELRHALAGFLGEQDQVPPAYSALRLSGERAHRMARRGAVFALAPRRVRIESLELLDYDYPRLRLRAVTGPGVYVRSLARDLGEVLGSAAYLTDLRREAIGPFHVSLAVDVTMARPLDIAARLLPPEAAVGHLPEIRLDATETEALLRGLRVRRAGWEAAEGKVRLLGPDGFIGVGACGSAALRALKILHVERGLR